MAAEQVQFTGKVPEKSEYEFYSGPKWEPRQVCLAVQPFLVIINAQ